MSKPKKSGAEMLSPQETVKVKVRHLSSFRKFCAILNVFQALGFIFRSLFPLLQLVLSGERDKLKKLAKEKLELSGWTDDLRRQCRGDNATYPYCRSPHISLRPYSFHPMPYSIFKEYTKAYFSTNVNLVLQSMPPVVEMNQ